MKPYMYILAVLLVGGGIGYFIGRKSLTTEHSLLTSPKTGSDDFQFIQEILEKQREAYHLHDALLLLRDCSATYVEINGNTGESYSLQKSVILYHELFKAGKSINFNLNNPEIKISRNFAVVKASYSKMSDSYEQAGIKGLAGEGVWMLSKSNNRWQINAFSWTEDSKG